MKAKSLAKIIGVQVSTLLSLIVFSYTLVIAVQVPRRRGIGGEVVSAVSTQSDTSTISARLTCSFTLKMQCSQKNIYLQAAPHLLAHAKNAVQKSTTKQQHICVVLISTHASNLFHHLR